MKRVGFRICLFGAIVIALSISGSSLAWFGPGHSQVARVAVMALPDNVPEFFRKGGDTIGHCSQDPDVFKDRSTPQLTSTESPEHYIDFELLQGKPLPPTRYEYLKLLSELKVEPVDGGLLPYAVIEGVQRLTIAFAEYRKYPTNPYIQAKCLIYAGNLAHYSGDLCQPLHCTIHHDGRAKPDNSSPRTGIHPKVDGLIERLNLDNAAALKDLEIKPIQGDLFKAILAQIDNSRSLVDKVYELEAKLPDAKTKAGDVAPEVVEFAKERLRTSAQFTARLYLTAWENSAKINLPAWDIRETPATQPAGK